MRKFNQQDLNQIQNILIALKKAKYEVQGDEILAFGQAIRWISGLYEEVTKDLKPASPSILDTVAKATTALKLSGKSKSKKKK